MPGIKKFLIPRNHHVEEALAAASDEHNLEPFQELLAILQRPYDENLSSAKFSEPAADSFTACNRTFCGTWSLYEGSRRPSKDRGRTRYRIHSRVSSQSHIVDIPLKASPCIYHRTWRFLDSQIGTLDSSSWDFQSSLDFSDSRTWAYNYSFWFSPGAQHVVCQPGWHSHFPSLLSLQPRLAKIGDMPLSESFVPKVSLEGSRDAYQKLRSFGSMESLLFSDHV